MSVNNWQPSCSVQALQQRAQLYQCIREFFSAHGVLAVETPVLSDETITDPYVNSFVLHDYSGKPQYLQTSPEFYMKRLLAAGCGDIYQIGKAFRAEERGRKHNPEFSMLEWYRRGMDLTALIAEVLELLTGLQSPYFQIKGMHEKTYQQWFETVLGINPHTADLPTLQSLSVPYYPMASQETERSVLLDLLMTHAIEPDFPAGCLCVVTDFPAEQAALAKTQWKNGVEVAQRFEVYFNGMELANGYDELRDATILKQRMLGDLALRARDEIGLVESHASRPSSLNKGKKLLAAMRHGLPACTGVAMGLDRLLMLIMGVDKISDVLSFTYADD